MSAQPVPSSVAGGGAAGGAGLKASSISRSASLKRSPSAAKLSTPEKHALLDSLMGTAPGDHDNAVLVRKLAERLRRWVVAHCCTHTGLPVAGTGRPRMTQNRRGGGGVTERCGCELEVDTAYRQQEQPGLVAAPQSCTRTHTDTHTRTRTAQWCSTIMYGMLARRERGQQRSQLGVRELGIRQDAC